MLALVANTMVAQLLYNSAGQLVLDSAFVVGYLLISAVCSTFAFALFEVSTIFQLHDLMALDASIKADIGAEKLIKRGYAVLAVSSLINFLTVLYFLALAWHTSGGHATAFPLDNLPEPWNWLYYSLHAAAYTAVLFLAGIFGERPKSGKEVILATQRALEQQALERWRMQKEAQIDQMVRDGLPARRGGRGARLARDGGAHRPHGSRHQRQPESARRRAAEPPARGAGLGGARRTARPGCRGGLDGGGGGRVARPFGTQPPRLIIAEAA